MTWKLYRKTEPVEAKLIEGLDDLPDTDHVTGYADVAKVVTKEWAIWSSYPLYHQRCLGVERVGRMLKLGSGE